MVGAILISAALFVIAFLARREYRSTKAVRSGTAALEAAALRSSLDDLTKATKAIAAVTQEAREGFSWEPLTTTIRVELDRLCDVLAVDRTGSIVEALSDPTRDTRHAELISTLSENNTEIGTLASTFITRDEAFRNLVSEVAKRVDDQEAHIWQIAVQAATGPKQLKMP